MTRAKGVLLILALLTLGGIVDSVYLTYDHYMAIADPDYGGGLCGEEGGCDISRFHPASEVPLGSLGPGIPIALLGFAFYLAFATLLVMRARRPDDPTPRRLHLAMAVGAVLYSIVLAAISIGAQGALCDYCAILYGINLALFGVSLFSLGESAGQWLRQLGSSIWSRAALVAAGVFIVTAGGTYAVYASGISSAMAAQAQGGGEPGVDIELADRPSKGPAVPKIHIVEISDFECPFCRRLFDTVEAFRADYPDDVRVTFLHFPLDKACNPMMPREFHQNACYYSALAICAGQQTDDGFFDAAKTLFSLGHGLERDAVVAKLVETGLDEDALRTCAASPETDAAIQRDLAIGAKLKVGGTPALIVNGRFISGDKPRAFFDELAEDAGITLKE